MNSTYINQLSSFLGEESAKVTTFKTWLLPSHFLVAIRSVDLEGCKALLAAGADCDQIFRVNSVSRSAISLGVERGAYNLVDLLIRYGVAINKRDSKGTPLHVAADMGYDEISSLLLDNRADINAADDRGVTPLHIAAKRGSLPLVQLFISHGADINKKDATGQNALCYACCAPTASFDVVKLLLEKGASVNNVDFTGGTPLLYSLMTHNYQCEVVELLISNGAHLDAVTRDCGRSPIHFVVLSSNPSKWKCLDLLMTSGCDINLMDSLGRSPVHIACLMNDVKSLRMLLRANANPNTRDLLGFSPLYIAIDSCLTECIQLLLASGAKEPPSNVLIWGRKGLSGPFLEKIVQHLSNVSSLAVLSRRAMCKHLGSALPQWVNDNKSEFPSSLRPFLMFEWQSPSPQ